MNDEELAMVSPWIDNGNIIDYLRDNTQTNALKLARNTPYPVYSFIESRHS
jgi:hypothetical protein